jgi:hypothetical protein
MSDEQNETAAKQNSRATPKRRSRAFARGLLAKLPGLAVTRWEAKDALNVHQRLKDVTDLNTDAFLQPLEPISRKSHD